MPRARCARTASKRSFTPAGFWRTLVWLSVSDREHASAMTLHTRRGPTGRYLVDSQRQLLRWGDVIDCPPGDVVWIRADYTLLGWLGPGRYELTAGRVPPFLEPWLGSPSLQLYFVARDAVPIQRSGLAFAHERTLHAIAELPFVLDASLAVASFERLHLVAKGMLDYGSFQAVLETESGLVTKKAIEDAAWHLPAEELLAFGSSQTERVQRNVCAWWDRYGLVATQFRLSVTTGGPLLHAIESARGGEPAEIRFGGRVMVIEEDGTRRTGVIADIEGPRAQVNWDDGGVAWVGSVRCLRPDGAPPGDGAPTNDVGLPESGAQRVLALSSDRGWQPATALRRVNGWWDVAWDHGPRAWLAPSFLRRLR